MNSEHCKPSSSSHQASCNQATEISPAEKNAYSSDSTQQHEQPLQPPLPLPPPPQRQQATFQQNQTITTTSSAMTQGMSSVADETHSSSSLAYQQTPGHPATFNSLGPTPMDMFYMPISSGNEVQATPTPDMMDDFMCDLGICGGLDLSNYLDEVLSGSYMG
jgi:hypothetical protein